MTEGAAALHEGASHPPGRKKTQEKKKKTKQNKKKTNKQTNKIITTLCFASGKSAVAFIDYIPNNQQRHNMYSRTHLIPILHELLLFPTSSAHNDRARAQAFELRHHKRQWSRTRTIVNSKPETPTGAMLGFYRGTRTSDRYRKLRLCRSSGERFQDMGRVHRALRDKPDWNRCRLADDVAPESTSAFPWGRTHP
uniref:Uncharacterized protein n=1 Tax=Physcomitrium patens TaxID=3218 RepID=A0A2K1JR54_PHYPA|nr:hypothetical protein PHYPA_016401 [Physcomitrium patens]